MRRFVRFRLRGLLIFVALCSIAFAWYATNARQRQTEISALEELDRLSYGRVAVLHDDDSLSCSVGAFGTVHVRQLASQLVHKAIACFGCDMLYRVQEVSLWGPLFDDRVIEVLTAFSSLHKVSLAGTKVTENGVRRLRIALPNTVVEFTPRSLPDTVYQFSGNPDDSFGSDEHASSDTGVVVVAEDHPFD